MRYLNSIRVGFENGLLMALFVGTGLVAFMELRAETPKPMIMFHAPMPDIRSESEPFDMTIVHNNRSIIHITKEAKSYLASSGKQLEVTSINAPALLRAQREGK